MVPTKANFRLLLLNTFSTCKLSLKEESNKIDSQYDKRVSNS